MDQVSLARVSVRAPVCVAQDGGGGGGRGEPDDGAAGLGPGGGQGAHGGGLAGPGRGDRELQPGAGGGHLRGPGAACPALRVVPLAADSSSASVDGRRVGDGAVAAAGGVDEALSRRRGSRCEV